MVNVGKYTIHGSYGYILLLGWWYTTYHPLQEPEKSIAQLFWINFELLVCLSKFSYPSWAGSMENDPSMYRKQDSTLVSMFHFHDWSRQIFNSQNLASSNKCTVSFKPIYLSVFVGSHESSDSSWGRKVIGILWSSSSWQNEELQRLNDRKIRQRIGWSWWWDKQRWLSDDQWTKKGGGNAGPGYQKKNAHFLQKYCAEWKQVE